jgi:hypothetical protein
MPPKKGTKKKAAKKAEPVAIRYMDLTTPMTEVELAGAFNVQQDDPLRRAVNQVLKKMRDEASKDLPASVDNHGKAAYAIGYEQAILQVEFELNKCYNWALDRLRQNAGEEEPPPASSGY